MITQLASALRAALRPLQGALSDPAQLDLLLGSLGWSLPEAPEEAACAALEDLLGVSEDLATLLEAATSPDLDEVAGAVEAGARVVRRLDELRALILATPEEREQAVTGVLTAMPPPLDDADALVAALGDLLDGLVSQWLADTAAPLHGLLRLLGVVSGSPVQHPPERISFSALTDLVAEPAAWMAEAYGWGGALHLEMLDTALRSIASLGPQPLQVEPVEEAVASAHWPAGQVPPAEVHQVVLPIVDGVAFLLVPVLPDADGWPTAVLLAPVVDPGVATTATAGAPGTSDGWTVAVTATGETDGSAGLLLRPGSPGPSGVAGVVVEPSHAAAPTGPLPDLAVTVEVSAPERTWALGGEGTRLEVRGLDVALGIRGTPEAPQPFLRVAAGDGLALVLAAPDGFLRLLLGDGLELSVDGDLEVSPDGLRVAGQVGLAVTLGVLELSLQVGTEPGSQELRLEATVSVGITIPPLSLSVEGVGLALLARPAPDGEGTLGPFDLSLQLLPPSAVALAVESDAVQGAGVLLVEDTRYVGGLSLQVLSLGIDAFAIIDTELPGQPDGFALLATLTARFPGIPLGFGFTLTGLGGLLALNRGIDSNALALGLRTGAADAVLFPDLAALAGATAGNGGVADLVEAMDAYFPLMADNLVVGPVLELGWGTPTVLTAQLGVFLSLPQGVVVVLGSFTVDLPTPDVPLVSLHLDVMGAVDLAAGTLLVTASLYDSWLLGFIELSGDAAAYLATQGTPYFLLSVGGFHPGFSPPSSAPAVLEELRRIRADVQVAVGVSASLQAYLAVTSNTVQAGGRFELEAATKIAGITFTARGWFGFDILVQFTPFLLIIDAEAGCAVMAKKTELLGVDVRAHLEGPEPWFATATASFRMLGFDVSFDVEVGSRAAPEVAPVVDVLALVAAELDSPAAWSAEQAATGDGLVLAEEDPAAADPAADTAADPAGPVLLRPQDTLVVRQSVVPFDQPLARLGELVPAQSMLRVTQVDLVPGVQRSDVTDWFAPAHYAVMNEADRLAAPSYELMPAGVRFGTEQVAVPEAEAVDAVEGYETAVWGEDDTVETAEGAGLAGGALTPLGVLTVPRTLDTVLTGSPVVAATRATHPVGVSLR